MMHSLGKVMFAVCLLALCWYGMMAVHELGHVVGAWATGGTVTGVSLHPLSISRTDVLPNPCPGIVVWLGPIVGCLLPLLLWALGRNWIAGKLFGFFAGFCLIANGAYIAFGSRDGVGDSGEMLRCGVPVWTLIAFGAIAILGGLMIWHRLDSVGHFFAAESTVTSWMVISTIIVLFLLLLTEFMLFAS
jgi:hypothetical protein